MKFNKKLLAFCIGIFSCASLNADHIVKIANDKTGDFLLAPFYEAKNDVCSQITVSNTNDKSSILAKVSIKEQVSSQAFDIPIFLRPNDTWEGSICDDYGEVYLLSSDDSNHPKIKSTLNQGKNLSTFAKVQGYRDSNFQRGYIEVYPIAQFIEKDVQKVDTNILVKRWDNLIKNQNFDKSLRKNGVDEDSLSAEVSFKTNDVITSNIPMIAFENTHSKVVFGNKLSYAFAAQANILLGENKKNQILKLLQNNSLSFSFDNYGENQLLYVNFPFSNKTNQERSFSLNVYDMNGKQSMENKYFMAMPKNIRFIMNNSLAIIPVSTLVNSTNTVKKIKKGRIVLKEIKNIKDYQLGSNKNASYIPSLVSTMSLREKFINTSSLVPVK